jgi:uncharacterized protein (DUF305 family)
MRRREWAAVCLICTAAVALSCARTPAPSLPTTGKDGEEFEREYLASRLHHHAETQNIVNTCIAKSQRPELVDFCKEIHSTADRVIGRLRDRANEWYGITVPPEADEEHGSELFRSFAERMKTATGPAFDKLTLQALRQQYRQGVDESVACEKAAVHEELRTACTTASQAQEKQLRRINDYICSWFKDCSDR